MPGKRVFFDINDAVKLYEAGKSTEEISEILGGSRKTVARRLKAAGFKLRSGPQGACLYYISKVDLSEALRRYAEGENMKSLCEEFRIGRRRMESALRHAGIPVRTLRQSVGLRYTRMSKSERQSLVARAHIAKKGKPADMGSQERRAKTLEVTLQLASRADLILGVWLGQRGLRFTPQKALRPYNLDIAIDELSIAVEVNGDWHYFPDPSAAESKRRDYLFDRGWRLIEVCITSTSARPWKYLRPACADKIIELLERVRRSESIGRKHWVIGGDGESLPGSCDEC
jgi:very-short-patch-repair endonuclease/transposase